MHYPSMPFVRAKQVKGCTYYYLCECVWVDGKPYQRVIAYLGQYRTVKAALAYWREEAQTKDKGRKQQAREMLKKLKPYA